MKHILIVFPNIYAMLTGVTRVRKFSDRIELQYTDGTVESAILPHALLDGIEWDSPMSIVGRVQEVSRHG